MGDAVQLAAFLGVAEDEPAERRPVQLAAVEEHGRTEHAADLVPGALARLHDWRHRDYFTNQVCTVGKSDSRRDVTQGNPLRPS